ncbi:hypothetical protein CBR_g9110 [Chara braunii]|uniref:tRNA (adenine(58)-N(1))-methyltransferase n=1 Tax=Chara braunii TaxID=69332 RepID=A0A388KNW7_CHABU|nr:hypothetical protein CBR_g9110 [Chara braunii]|eukprot:GBG71698.1 hypothetical protein CBR_g9110 [Chara braunii]
MIGTAPAFLASTQEEGLSSSTAPTRQHRAIQEGDLVIVYEGHERMRAVRVSSKGRFEDKWGVFFQERWIGCPFGSRVFADRGDGFVHLLAPSPELWTLVLPHRTQILYMADISLVISFLELRPGVVVLESGTGSGSLTTSLARAVSPHGHVHTFEFHAQRAAVAKEEFAKNGLDSIVAVDVRDIQGEGFPEHLAGKADAVFLDLPGPWEAVPSAARSLRPDGVFCSFSPCIEQVQRCCAALHKHGFVDVRTFEVLLRTYNLRSETQITDLRSTTGQSQHGNGQQDLTAMGGAGVGVTDSDWEDHRVKRLRAEEEAKTEGVEDRGDDSILEESGGPKMTGPDHSINTTGGDPGTKLGRAIQQGLMGESAPQALSSPFRHRRVTAICSSDARGHTGYLTFARRCAIAAAAAADDDDDKKNALRKGSWGWRRAVAAFGPGILRDDREVNREVLGDLVFKDVEKRRKLNWATWPSIFMGMFKELAWLWLVGSPVAVLDAPLLFEACLTWLASPIAVIWVPRSVQEQRLMSRDNITLEQAQQRIDAQLPLEWKRARADIVIDNSGSIEELRAQVERFSVEIQAPRGWRGWLSSRGGVGTAIVAVSVCLWVLWSWVGKADGLG